MLKTRMMMMGLIVALMGLAVACQSGSPTSATPEAPAQAEAPTQAAPQFPVTNEGVAEIPRSGLPGVVQEIHHAGGYTYLRVTTGSGDVWAAAPTLEVAQGATVVVPSGTKMTNFHSKTLNRTFPEIFFVESIQGAKLVNQDGAQPTSAPGSAPASAPDSQAASAPGVNPHQPTSPGAGAASPQVDVSGLVKPEGGHTIAEIFAGKAELGGKTVKLRGKVVKYNAQIMGRNWLHIQDGTGQSASKTHDLTVTSASEAKVGDTVLIEGKVAVDKDFGAGYRYDLIVEDASLTVE